jgi:hypothetical protein
MKPRWQEIEKELPWLETEFLDFDQNSDKVAVYSPDETKLPVAIFLDKDGKEFDRKYGEVSKKDLIEFVNTHKEK